MVIFMVCEVLSKCMSSEDCSFGINHLTVVPSNTITSSLQEEKDQEETNCEHNHMNACECE